MKKNNELTIKELCDLKYNNNKLVVPLGWTPDNNIFYKNFKRISGLFVAGATGSGKSVFIDDLIVSLMYKNTPEEVKFIMFDPKKIELGEYDGIKYLLNGKSEYNLKKSYDTLLFLLRVLESRFNTLNKCGLPSIEAYNKTNEEKWPHIFIFIDEGSKIIKVKDVHNILSKILDYGSIIGIHLIFATNSYLKDYANSKFIDQFKYRITFDLASTEQAEFMNMKKGSWLKNNGEALIKCRNSKIYKFQAPMVKDEEIEEVVLQNM